MAEFLIKLIVAIIIGVSNAIIFIYRGDYQWINYPKTKIKKIEENQRTLVLAAFTMIEVFVILILMGAEV